MASEATISSSLSIRKGKQVYSSGPGGFSATVVNSGGPTPGAVLCALAGTTISLSQLTTPGLCRIQNLDPTNYVTVGVYDGTSFYPFMELMAGESYVFRLSRNLNSEFVGVGTNSDVNYLRIMADTAECLVLVEAFEK